MPNIKPTATGWDKVTETVGETAPKVIPPVVETVGNTTKEMTKDISTATKESIQEVSTASTVWSKNIKLIVSFIIIRFTRRWNNCSNHFISFKTKKISSRKRNRNYHRYN